LFIATGFFGIVRSALIDIRIRRGMGPRRRSFARDITRASNGGQHESRLLHEAFCKASMARPADATIHGSM
jgi:hypothetical protein